MALKIKSLKETTEKSDGLRILIARYRPSSKNLKRIGMKGGKI
jgi:uncharacterized protein YeaO (DUF488 family)